MFNNVWFYVLVYMAIGTGAVIANVTGYKKARMEIEEKDWGAVLEFDSKALIHCKTMTITYITIAIAYVLWPIFLVIATVKRVKAYETIMEELLKKERYQKEFDELKEKWLAQ